MTTRTLPFLHVLRRDRSASEPKNVGPTHPTLQEQSSSEALYDSDLVFGDRITLTTQKEVVT